MHETIDGDKEELTRFKAIRDDALPSITFKKNEALCTIDNVTYQITYANGRVTKLSQYLRSSRKFGDLFLTLVFAYNFYKFVV